jgi:hypothetical protein
MYGDRNRLQYYFDLLPVSVRFMKARSVERRGLTPSTFPKVKEVALKLTYRTGRFFLKLPRLHFVYLLLKRFLNFGLGVLMFQISTDKTNFVASLATGSCI